MSRIADPQNFFDNLKNLGVVMSVALEHARNNLSQFLKNGTAHQFRQVARPVAKIRTLAAQFEKEFAALDYLIGKTQKSSGGRVHKLIQ